MRCPPRHGKPPEASRLLSINTWHPLRILSFPAFTVCNRGAPTQRARGFCLVGGPLAPNTTRTFHGGPVHVLLPRKPTQSPRFSNSRCHRRIRALAARVL